MLLVVVKFAHHCGLLEYHKLLPSGIHEFIRVGLAASASGVAQNSAPPWTGCSHGALLQHLPFTLHVGQAELALVSASAAGQPHLSGKPCRLYFFDVIKKNSLLAETREDILIVAKLMVNFWKWKETWRIMAMSNKWAVYITKIK